MCVALYPPPEVGGFTATGDKKNTDKFISVFWLDPARSSARSKELSLKIRARSQTSNELLKQSVSRHP